MRPGVVFLPELLLAGLPGLVIHDLELQILFGLGVLLVPLLLEFFQDLLPAHFCLEFQLEPGAKVVQLDLLAVQALLLEPLADLGKKQ